MLTSNFNDVGIFHHKFDLPTVSHDGPAPREVDEETFEYRRKFMQEELDETVAAYQRGDLAGVADGLIDLVYVALGTAHFFGFPWQQLWDEVQRANIQKERARSANDDRSQRGNSLDVVKPAGWRPPDIAGVLRAYGFPLEVLA